MTELQSPADSSHLIQTFLAKNLTPTIGVNGTMIQYPIGRRKRKGRSNTTWTNGKGEKWNLRNRIGEIETRCNRKKNTAPCRFEKQKRILGAKGGS